MPWIWDMPEGLAAKNDNARVITRIGINKVER
jgi:hypothetical protein